MTELTPLLRPERPTGHRWHPLPAPGERFPVADPALTFAPEPLPADELELFQALLEGVAQVEARAYELIRELGGPTLRTLRTVGGGAANPGWTRIRAAAARRADAAGHPPRGGLRNRPAGAPGTCTWLSPAGPTWLSPSPAG